LSRPKLVMRLGKTPGQMTLTVMWSGIIFEAWSRVRWMHAAFDGPSVVCGQQEFVKVADCFDYMRRFHLQALIVHHCRQS
jgi:hypothetical protein